MVVKKGVLAKIISGKHKNDKFLEIIEVKRDCNNKKKVAQVKIKGINVKLKYCYLEKGGKNRKKSMVFSESFIDRSNIKLYNE